MELEQRAAAAEQRLAALEEKLASLNLAGSMPMLGAAAFNHHHVASSQAVIQMPYKSEYRLLMYCVVGVTKATTTCPLPQALEKENAKLRYQVLHLKRAVVEATG